MTSGLRLVRMTALLAVATLLLGVPPTAAADPGDLDPTFGQGGRVITDAGDEDFASAVAVQDDGRIVVAGEASVGGTARFLVVRYLTDGTLDPSFGDGGVVLTAFDGPARAFDLAIQVDGRIVAVGSALAGDTDFAAARYLADGTLDATFGGDGTVTTDLGGVDLAHAVAVQADGRIVAAGFSVRFETDFAVVRYLSDGTLDPSFGGDGRVGIDVAHTDIANGVAVQPDGAVVVVGNTFNQRGGNFAVARLKATGKLDPSFGGDGTVTTAFGPGDNSATDVAVQPDGRIVVVGSAVDVRGIAFGLVRYLPNGTRDDGFGENGKVVTKFGLGDEYALAVAVQPDGRIVAVGNATNRRGPNFALARYLTDGALDPTFSGDGVVVTDFGGEESALGVALQSDGRIVAAGRTFDPDTFAFDVALARYLAS